MLDLFPFDLRPGLGAVFLWLLLSAATLWLTRWVRDWVGARLDGIDLPIDEPEERSDFVHGHNTAASLPPPPLTIGRRPLPGQHWTIGYLRAGHRGVEEAMIGRMFGEGWLSASAGVPGTYSFDGATTPRDPRLSKFHLELLRGRLQGKLTSRDVVEHAGVAADRYGAGCADELAAAYFVRPRSTVRRLRLLVLAGGLVAQALATTPLVANAQTEWPPLARPALVVGMVALAIVTVSMLFGLRRSSNGAKYLTWLREETRELLERVRSGRTRAPHDISLAVALEGLGSLPMEGIRALQEELGRRRPEVVRDDGSWVPPP
jgi:hypothetical protein